jgi:hypothetical protein
MTVPPMNDVVDRRKEWLLGSLTVVLTVAACLVVAEVVLRFLPVASGMRTLAVNAQNPVFHSTPNRDFTFSTGWNMELAHRGHINNAGFVNDQDYDKDGSRPLLAVVGDSMIEAAMVPYRETLHGRLAEALEGKRRVYSFAASGAPLSQYLIWARHAVHEYRADALLISVVGNDFDESHAAHKTSAGFWRYVPGENKELHLRLFEYRPTILSRAVHASALARYLVFNLKIGFVWTELRHLLFGGPAMAQPADPGIASAGSNDLRVRDSLAAMDAFFRDLPRYAALPPSRILFVIDGFRYPDAAAASVGTYLDRMRKAFLERPKRAATSPSISIQFSSGIIAAPARASNSPAIRIGARPVMGSRSRRSWRRRFWRALGRRHLSTGSSATPRRCGRPP